MIFYDKKMDRNKTVLITGTSSGFWQKPPPGCLQIKAGMSSPRCVGPKSKKELAGLDKRAGGAA